MAASHSTSAVTVNNCAESARPKTGISASTIFEKTLKDDCPSSRKK